MMLIIPNLTYRFNAIKIPTDTQIMNILKRELQKQSIYNTFKITKCLGLIKVKDLKMKFALLKEIKEHIHKWKHISCSWVVKLTVKCQYYPKQSTESVQSPSNSQ